MGAWCLNSPFWFSPIPVFVFLWLVFFVFFLVSTAVLLGIRDNYYRYAQKASLQWTGSAKPPRSRLPLLWVGLFSMLTAAAVVRWIIFP